MQPEVLACPSYVCRAVYTITTSSANHKANPRQEVRVWKELNQLALGHSEAVSRSSIKYNVEGFVAVAPRICYLLPVSTVYYKEGGTALRAGARVARQVAHK